MNTVCLHRLNSITRDALLMLLLSGLIVTTLRAGISVTCEVTSAGGNGTPSSSSARFTAGPFATMAQARAWCQDNGAVDVTFSGSEDGQASSSGGVAAGGQDSAEQLGHQLGTAIGNELSNALFGNKASNGPSQADFQQGQMQIAAQQLNNTGLWYLRQRDYPSAINEFQQALARSPNDPSIAANLAAAQQQYALTQKGAAEAAKARTASNQLPGAPAIASAVPDPNGDQSGQTLTGGNGGPGAGSQQGTTEGNPVAAPINAEFGKLYNEPIATPPVANGNPGSAATQEPAQTNSTEQQKNDGGLGGLYNPPAANAGNAPETAPASPLAQELNSSPGGVGNPDFDGDAGGNAPLGKANLNGAAPDPGDTSVVDLRGKTGIVDSSAPAKAPPAAASADADTAPVEPGTKATPSVVDRLVIPGSSGVSLPRPSGAVPPARTIPASNRVLDAMYASASSYYPGADATQDYRFITAFSFDRNGINAVLYGEWNVDFNGKTLAEIDEAEKQPPSRVILAFRGTDDALDWITNIRNTFGHKAPEFEAAVGIARGIKYKYGDIPILLTGHSLGGGEAALASLATDLPAITFNAEGVRPSDYGYSSTVDTSQISNFFVVAEPLTTSQVVSYGTGKLTGNELTSMALQVGEQIPLKPMTVPSISNRGNHSMTAVEPAVLNYFSRTGP